MEKLKKEDVINLIAKMLVMANMQNEDIFELMCLSEKYEISYKTKSYKVTLIIEENDEE